MNRMVWAFYYSLICIIVGYGSGCGPPTPPYGSTIIHPPKQEKHADGSVVLFGCKQGFYLVGQPLIKCAGKTWTQKKFRCVGFCPDFRHILNGEVVHVSPSIGKAAVRFRCNKEFRLIGTPRLECINGKWNGMLPFCEKLRSCARLRAPANGTLQGTGTSHGAKANFACLTGFDLFGLPTLTCKNGAWSATVPSCKAYCMKIKDPSNGRKFETHFSHGRVVSFECKSGYELNGDRALRCINGRWNSTVPVCKAMLCSKPSIPSNSYIIYPRPNQVNYIHGTNVFLACRDGHYLEGSPIMVCNQTVWIKRKFSCIASCPAFGSIKSGIITHVTLKGGGEVEIKCLTNYTLVGSPKLSCINGRWNGILPSCKAACDDPGLIEHGRKAGNDFSHGKIVTYECTAPGYSLEGNPRLTCTNGNWDSGRPKCKAQCDEPAPPVHGWKSGRDFSHGQTVSFYCRFGYSRVGASLITCNDGKWDKQIPICKVVQCDNPGNPRNGKGVVNKGYVYGGSVTFNCDHDYILRGTPITYCQEDKTWTASVPECLAPCPDPGDPYQGNMIDNDFRHGQTVKFQCPRNYVMNGAQTMTCSNGHWSNVKPSCQACGLALGMENKRIEDEQLSQSQPKIQTSSPSWGRLHGPYGWCTNVFGYTLSTAFIQVDFHKTTRIMAIETQGSEFDMSWVTQYSLKYKAGYEFVWYKENNSKKIFQGNKDASGIVKHMLQKPIISRALQVVPASHNSWPCLRMELYGCEVK